MPDANTVVGKEIDCDATGHLISLAAGNANATVYKARVTKEGATVMNLSWQGSTSAGDRQVIRIDSLRNNSAARFIDNIGSQRHQRCARYMGKAESGTGTSSERH